MKLATAAKLPKTTSAKVSDPDNPAWTEDMLGPVLDLTNIEFDPPKLTGKLYRPADLS